MYDYHELDDRNMKGTLRDWRKALRTPATYRVGNAVRIQPQFIYLILLIGGILLLLSYYNWWTGNQVMTEHRWTNSLRQYNTTYPLTAPFESAELVTFRIGIVADLDKKSKSKSKPHAYFSYFKKGYLSYHRVKKYVTVTWDSSPALTLSSTYSHKGRGMELSELIVYDGRLLTFDDRSGMHCCKHHDHREKYLRVGVFGCELVNSGNGVDHMKVVRKKVYEILNKNRVVPWVVLPDGNGHMEKGFKAEWATIKDEILYVGSMGKEWTTASGEFETYDPMWVKAVNIHGEVQHLSWTNQYKAIRSNIGIEWPGYMIHESAAWSSIKKKWFFLPRKCSHNTYNETSDELMGCNYMIITDTDFKTIHSYEISERQPERGFSSFKFIPGTDDEAIVALKTVEYQDNTATYITAFSIDGKVLLPDTMVENQKYEGIEFI